MIGDLDRRVSLYTFTSSPDDFGQRVETPTLLATVWASVQASGGREQKEANKETATNELQFIIRFRTDINEKTRIVYSGNNYDIIEIQEALPDRKRYLTIKAERKY
jgi:SPP1 family predicted phage head-tail adaptor